MTITPTLDAETAALVAAYAVTCPRCGSEPGQACRNLRIKAADPSWPADDLRYEHQQATFRPHAQRITY